MTQGSLKGIFTPNVVPLDANGDLTLNYTQPAGWTGLFAFQALLYEADGHLIGTSDFVIND